jgi:hypothetical protein
MTIGIPFSLLNAYYCGMTTGFFLFLFFSLFFHYVYYCDILYFFELFRIVFRAVNSEIVREIPDSSATVPIL